MKATTKPNEESRNNFWVGLAHSAFSYPTTVQAPAQAHVFLAALPFATHHFSGEQVMHDVVHEVLRDVIHDVMCCDWV